MQLGNSSTRCLLGSLRHSAGGSSGAETFKMAAGMAGMARGQLGLTLQQVVWIIFSVAQSSKRVEAAKFFKGQVKTKSQGQAKEKIPSMHVQGWKVLLVAIFGGDLPQEKESGLFLHMPAFSVTSIQLLGGRLMGQERWLLISVGVFQHLQGEVKNSQELSRLSKRGGLLKGTQTQGSSSKIRVKMSPWMGKEPEPPYMCDRGEPVTVMPG